MVKYIIITMFLLTSTSGLCQIDCDFVPQGMVPIDPDMYHNETTNDLYLDHIEVFRTSNISYWHAPNIYAGYKYTTTSLGLRPPSTYWGDSDTGGGTYTDHYSRGGFRDGFRVLDSHDEDNQGDGQELINNNDYVFDDVNRDDDASPQIGACIFRADANGRIVLSAGFRVYGRNDSKSFLNNFNPNDGIDTPSYDGMYFHAYAGDRFACEPWEPVTNNGFEQNYSECSNCGTGDVIDEINGTSNTDNWWWQGMQWDDFSGYENPNYICSPVPSENFILNCSSYPNTRDYYYDNQNISYNSSEQAFQLLATHVNPCSNPYCTVDYSIRDSKTSGLWTSKNIKEALPSENLGGSLLFGRFEVRLKFPTGRGHHPAVWSHVEQGIGSENFNADEQCYRQFDPEGSYNEIDIIDASTGWYNKFWNPYWYGPLGDQSDDWKGSECKAFHYSCGVVGRDKQFNRASSRSIVIEHPDIENGGNFSDEYNDFAFEWIPGEIRFLRRNENRNNGEWEEVARTTRSIPVFKQALWINHQISPWKRGFTTSVTSPAFDDDNDGCNENNPYDHDQNHSIHYPPGVEGVTDLNNDGNPVSSGNPYGNEDLVGDGDAMYIRNIKVQRYTNAPCHTNSTNDPSTPPKVDQRKETEISIEELQKIDLKIYSQSAGSKFLATIIVPNEMTIPKLEIYNSLGVMVKEYPLGSLSEGRNTKEIDLSNVAQGTYYIRIPLKNQAISRSIQIIR